MIVLEILMILLGLGAIGYSFRLIEGKQETEKEQQQAPATDSKVQESPVDWEHSLWELREKVESLYEETDDKLSQLSNEKIMGMSEYSDQVLDKIEKNHGEVVFLYDMMNEKKEEIQQLIKNIDGMKADLHDEAAQEFQKLKEQEKVLEQLRKDIEVESLEYQAQKEELQRAWEALEEKVMETEASDIPMTLEQPDVKEEVQIPAGEMLEREMPSDAVSQMESKSSSEEEASSSIFDVEIARIEEEEAKALLVEENGDKGKSSSEYQPLSAQEKPVNHNDEIIALYKKGRSILDISKMLALGQGEVKFVIDLYDAR